MNIIICDDEPSILHQISNKLQAQMPENNIIEMSDPLQLLLLLQEEEYDVLLLDIDMPGMNGLEIAKSMENLKKKPLLVFVTNHDELVYDSFWFHPFGFVRKECMDTELPRVLQDCEKELSSRDRYYCIHTVEGEVRLRLEDIYYFESEGNYLNTYTEKNCYRFRDTISSVQKELERDGFIRIHRGFLINQDVVEVLGADELKLINGTKLPIGRSYAEDTRKQIMRYMLR